MSTDRDADSAKRLVTQTQAVLLDFDRPATQLLTEGRNARLADQLRAVLAGAGVFVPDYMHRTTDHLKVLRFALETQAVDVVRLVDDASVSGEVAAASLSKPTQGAHQAIQALHDAGKPIVIVSNNAEAAVRQYLERFALAQHVVGVEGRPYAQPLLMNPIPSSSTEPS